MHQRGLHITTNFHVIKCWIEKRKGTPAVIEANGVRFPTVTFEYMPKVHTAKLDWDEFFELVADSGTAFMYEADHEDGSPALFFKFVPWECYVDELKEEEKVEDQMTIAQNCFS